MAALTDVKAIATTAAAKAASAKKGAPVDALMQTLQLQIIEIQRLLRQIIALTPSGDANLTALNTLLAELT